MATVQAPEKINMATDYDLKSVAGPVAQYETTATWSVGEGQPKGSAKGMFPGPAYPDKPTITAYIGTLDAGGVGKFFDAWYYGASLKCKATLRPQVGVDSPWITRDGVRINLATGERFNTKTNTKASDLPLEKRIAAVNAGFEDAVNLGGDVKDSFIVAKRMLLESKLAAEANGKLVVAKK